MKKIAHRRQRRQNDRRTADGAAKRVSPALARGLSEALRTWFARTARALPWRNASDSYTVWVSEIMLQQTRVETVIPYYEKFMQTFPTVETLAAAGDDELMRLWAGLGYYRRAHHLRRAAQIIVQERAGVLPDHAAEWRTLPGIGDYTAGAIASIAHGQRCAAVDGNAMRVLARLFFITEPIATNKTKILLWQLAEALVPAEAPGEHNQALMELGATLCLPRAPRCDACPVRGRCLARRRGMAESLPVRPPRRPPPHRHAVIAVIRRDDAVLLAKRSADGMLAKLWEFPRIWLQNPVDDHMLGVRLREQLGVAVRVGPTLGALEHAYTHFSVEAAVRSCTIDRAPVCSRMHEAVAWASLTALETWPMSALDRKVAALLAPG